MDKRRAGATVFGSVAAAVLAIGGTVGIAWGSAANKRPGYTSTAESSAGAAVPAPGGLPSLVVLGSESSSQTAESGASSSSSAGTVLIGGVGSGVSCSSSGPSSAHAGVGPIPAGPVTVAVLSSSCEARAVQSNNASSSASTSVLEVGVDPAVAPVDVVVLGSTSSTKTTSGQSGSGQTRSSFTVVTLNETNLLGCEAESHTTKGTTATSSSVVVAGAPVPESQCPLTSAETNLVRD